MSHKRSIFPTSILIALGFAAPVPAQETATPEPPPIRALRTGGLKAEVAALIMSGQQGGAIALEALALPLAAAGQKTRVLLVLEAGGAGLLAGRGDGPLAVELYAYALSESGSLQDSLLQTFEIDPERLEVDLASGGLKFRGELELLPGTYSLRILVRSGPEHVGMRQLPLRVPAPGEVEPLLLPPLLEDARGAWLELREVREGGGPADELLAAAPAAKPVIAQGGEISFRLPAHNLAAVGSELVVEIHDSRGQTLELPARVTGYGAGSETGLRMLEAVFEPRRLPAGSYHLRAVASEPGGGRVQSELVPVVLGGTEVAGKAWPQLSGELEPAAARVAAADAPPPPRRKSRVRDREVVAAYRKPLEILAGGDLGGARAELYETTEKLAREQGLSGLAALAEAEVDVAKELVRRDSRALLPLIATHYWLYQEARQRNQSLISTHARNATQRLVDLYAAADASPAAQERAARILANLGGQLQEAGLGRMSGGVFRRALGFDESNEPALLALAAGHELLGEHEEALDYLERLVKLRPGSGHGRLRLAMNLLHLGREKAARRHFQEITAGDYRPWVVSLAYQELARLELRERRPDQAETLLRQALERVPEDEKLYLQLAFVYDALQKPLEARETLEKLSLKASRNGFSPRHRYTLWPNEELAAAWRAFEDEAEDGLGAFAAAFAALPGEKG